MLNRIITYLALLMLIITAVLGPIPVALFYRMVWPNDEQRKMQMHRILSSYFRWCARNFPLVRFDLSIPASTFERPAIIICNHQSMLDLPSILMLSPRIVAVTNQWVWNYPLFKPVIRYLEFYPSSGLEGNEESIRSMLQRGYSVLIFPEGTRSTDQHVLKFHRGAFYLAERLNADILPLYIQGAGRALPKQDFCLNKSDIMIHVGNRLSADDTTMGTNYREQSRAFHKYYIEWENAILS